MKTILLVDDEAQILKALYRVFMDTDYDILTAENGHKALELLKNNKVDLILSDMRMPIMDGYELLSQVKALYPRTTRIILSGYSDEKVIFNSLQKNIAKLYIMKPWENDKLLQVIAQVFIMEEKLTSANLLTIINEMEYLPTIRESYQRILQLIDQEENISKISTEIERDQSIASKILHVANSAYYNSKTGSIKQSILNIGIQNTRNLVLSTSVVDNFQTNDILKEYLELIWKHAYTTNRVLSFIFDKHLNKKIPDALSTTGLLHNIGIAVYLYNYGEEYLNSLLKANKEKRSIYEYEITMFHATHNEVGSYLLNWWGFPYPIVEAAMYHHDPFNVNITNTELVCALHIAQRYAWKLMNIEIYEEFDSRTLVTLNILTDDFEKSLDIFMTNTYD